MKNKKKSQKYLIYQQVKENLNILKEELKIIDQKLNYVIILSILLITLSLIFDNDSIINTIFIVIYVITVLTSLIVAIIPLFISNYKPSNNEDYLILLKQNKQKIKNKINQNLSHKQDTLNKIYSFKSRCLKSSYILLIIGLVFFTVNIFWEIF